MKIAREQKPKRSLQMGIYVSMFCLYCAWIVRYGNKLESIFLRSILISLSIFVDPSGRWHRT